MPSILTLPTEVVISVFHHCSTSSHVDVAALSATCKQFHYVWLRHASSILGDALCRQIRAFDDAVMAVRATEIVKDAVRAGQLPPDPFPTAQLRAGRTRHLSVEEIRGVYNFHHLARCIEQVFLKDRDESWFGSEHLGGEGVDFESDPQKWDHWRNRFYSTVYRFFLASAMLYRAYQEPHVLPAAAEGRPLDFLKRLKDNLAECRASVEGWYDEEAGLAESDVQYLLKFPVFDFEAYERHHPAYGQLAAFLYDLSRDRLLRNDDIPTDEPIRGHLFTDHHFGNMSQETDPVKAVFFCETMQLLLMTELLCPTQRKDVFLDGLDPTLEDNGSLGVLQLTEPPCSRRVSAVRFGRFSLDEIIMPCAADETSFNLPAAIPVADQPGFPDTDSLLREMFTQSGQPNHYDRDLEAARPQLQFVQYLLRKYFNLRFSDRAFEVWTECPYRMLYTNGDLFLEVGYIGGYFLCDNNHPSTVGGLFVSADKTHRNLHYAHTF